MRMTMPWRGRARATKVGAPLGRRRCSAGPALCYSGVALDQPLGPHSRSATPHPTPPSLTYSTGASLRRIEAHHRHKKTQSLQHRTHRHIQIEWRGGGEKWGSGEKGVVDEGRRRREGEAEGRSPSRGSGRGEAGDGDKGHRRADLGE